MNRKKSKFSIVLYLVLLTPAFCLAKVVTTYSLDSPITKTIEEWADQDTIVFIGLDDVLFTPEASMFRYNSPYRNFIQELIANLGKMPANKQLVETWYSQRKLRLVEAGWPEFIEHLQAKGARVYGLCAIPIYIKDMDKKILEEVRVLGINFTDEINKNKMVKIFEQDGWQSVFYNGILFSGPLSKAKAIVDFMKTSKLAPKKVVVFDNAKYIIKQIDKSLKVFDMDFYNIEYLAASQQASSIDPKIVRLQQEQLILNNKWLEDDQAKSMVELNPGK